MARERMLPARLIRPLRFAIVGVSNTLIDVGVFSLLALGLAVLPATANVVSYAVGTANSWVLNRCWTFHDLAGSGSGAQFAGFAAINLAILGLSTALVWALAPVVGPLLAKLTAVLVCFGANYTLCRTLVFRGTA